MNKPRYLLLVTLVLVGCPDQQRQRRGDPCRGFRLRIGAECPHPDHEMVLVGSEDRLVCRCPRPERPTSSDAEGT